jgi:predicted RNase H-like nuclease (RuvC/YqgF family)
MSDNTFDFSTLTEEQKKLIFNEMLEKQKEEEAEAEKEIRELEEKKKKYTEKLSRINEKRREKVPCGKCGKET